ncbi:PD-(D/E)XK motif protein [Salmonella enterica subsp. enterica serovar Derby]|uniref:PD-(D/E)XK motif protein n=1 Tax=Salmonella derby TaxID=28144 RepID=A0A630V0K1_SALDE|nr:MULTISPECIES: PD-(D/E)XK motif protein [Enterobacteriaceae]EAB8340884.1 PD-(D/E)XK motif protein [Salmonella enterica subsp. enterica serovar Abaetetuba]ECB1042834.1 PD-(D/E)XK motif protein [Salmonella enterica subsp. enterica serovar Aschersleben]ECK8871164.1 PD-(D/E)XK motif protein [Salmonella enterica subsp. enterica]EDI0458071.1 PD-(D/E)XK motif protein [Salmonella enterica subsp. enterica serovar Weston]EDU1644142.1 PD-(D/E)XK motif protein [Salmonella enterica subsp. enterica serova
MKTTPETLLNQWDNIIYKDGGFLQIDTQHPLEWHIGYQSANQRTLLLVCNAEINAIESSKSMIVSRRQREIDNRWTLTFELMRNAEQDVFAIFCCDIIEFSRTASDEKEALTFVIKRYRQWSRLLELQKNGLMDENKCKGLLGELLFLEEYMSYGGSVQNAVQGWVGAEGADQDFMYSEGWYEVKSIGISAASVTISSLEQLDCTLAGELVVVRIDKVAPEREGSISLNEMVCRICSKLSPYSDSLELFQHKLTSYGYIDIKEYSEQKYYYQGMQRYEVDTLFPRLTSNSVPIEVLSLSYELSLPAMSKWLKG